jgi:hypothetical protein
MAELQYDLLDYVPPAVVRRDAALAQVEANSGEWMALAMIAAQQSVRSLPERFLPEDIRTAVVRSCGEPHHYNVFGALIRKLVKERLIEQTGEIGRSRRPESNATSAPFYRRCA